MSRFRRTVAETLIGLTDNPVVFLLIVNVLLLILGMLLEPTSALIIITPILLPVAMSFGVDPLQLGSIVIFNLMIGLITPPMGGVVFVLSSVTGLPLERVFRGAAYYLPALIVVLLLITYVSAITLWLPGLHRACERGRLRCLSSRRRASSSTAWAGPVNRSRSVYVRSTLDMPKSSTHRLLNELAALGIVRRTDDGRYSLGPRLLYWGEAAADTFDLRQVAEQANAHLARPTGRECPFIYPRARHPDLHRGRRRTAGPSALHPARAAPFLFGSERPASCCWPLPIVRSRTSSSSRARDEAPEQAQCARCHAG